MILTVDVETFAAQRRGIVQRADAQLEPLVRSGLARYHSDEHWYSEVRDAALALWDATAHEEFPDPSPVIAAVREEFADLVTKTLAKTTEPADPVTDGEVERIVFWLSTFSINSATMAAAMADENDATLEWVTMRDDEVRPSHREARGQVIPVGGTFEIDGHEVHHPGEPVGPPEIWIRCRCMVRPGIRGDASMANETGSVRLEFKNLTPEAIAALTAAGKEAPVEEDLVDPDDLAGIPPEAWDELESDVVWHGVLAPVNKMSGDKRKLGPNPQFRDFPFPMRFLPADNGAHTGAVPVANVQKAWLDGDLIKAEGTWRGDSEFTDEAITLVAEQIQSGVSVDLDSMVFELQDDDGNPFDLESIDPSAGLMPDPVMYANEYRISGSTIVPIPAFQEAFIALGPWEDDEVEPESAPEPDEAMVAGPGCMPCEATIMMEAAGAPPEHIKHVLEVAHGDFRDIAYTTPDGTEYRFSSDGLQVFAPGTRDGPGWITNPKETQRLRTYWVRGKGAAKIRWGQPGDFNRCRKQLAKYIKPNFLAGTCANLHKEAIKVWPGRERGGKHAVVASATAPAFTLVASVGAIPAEWFEDPHLTDVTPITVDEDGRVYGHVAQWNTCHIGRQYAGRCVTPPHSNTGYAWFHQSGTVLTTTGAMRVGCITYGVGHADPRANAIAALAHYDNKGTAMAHVRAGEDEFGIWVAGVTKPGITDEEKYNLRASAMSGDWRPDGQGGQELIAALACNVPGFPLPATTLVASAGEAGTLYGAGIVKQRIEQLSIRAAVRAELLSMQEEQRLAQERQERREAAHRRAQDIRRKAALARVK